MLETRNGGISSHLRAELARALAGGQRTLTPQELAGRLDIDPVTAAKKLARWADQGWMRRVRRGLYIPVPVDAADSRSWSEDPLLLGTVVWSPCYFTGWTAANHWALTEQIFRTTVLKTTERVRHSVERLLDHEYLLSHVMPKNLDWGLSTVWRSEHRLLMADPSRTVIDALDNPRLIGGVRHLGEILDTYSAEHDFSTLLEYGDRLGNRTVFKRLGYIASQAEISDQELIAACQQRISSGIALLDPAGAAGGKLVPEWGLRANVTVERGGNS
jgi:predicted transcriptional regulator of viral defense system